MRNRGYLTAIAGLMSLGLMAGGALAEPKTNMLHQWDSGSDAAAIAKLGEMFTAAGGKWEQTSIAGHTANTLAKLRADVIAGNAPPAVQLKGPEIAEWNATGKTADLDAQAKEEGWEKVTGFRNAHQFTFPMLPDEHRQIYKLFATQYIPRTLLIDPTGKVVFESTGYSPADFEQLEKAVASLLQ